MGIAEVGQLFSGYLEMSRMGRLKKYDSLTGSEEAEVVLVFLAVDWAIWGSAWEMEVRKCISSERLVEKAERMTEKLLTLVSHCLEYFVL